ncbi:MAG TPA: CoA transferase [Acetobacteraceae bacterium]|nr:CoA transferase [Acetobacteraceae bacterium]
MALFDGLKVIECATYIAGPSAASVLAEFGADVVKIEAPGGDPYRARSIPPTSGYVHPRNPGFMLDGRSRRSIVLDLARAEGQAVLRRLIAQVDVFITNSPPDVRRKLGVTYEALGPENPRLIYAAFTGYGERGPDRNRPGFDVTAWWARSGMMHLVRAADAVPARSLGGMGDHPSGMALYAAIATALYQRERTGRGMAVGSSLLANGLWANASQVQARLLGEDVAVQPPRAQSRHPLRNHYRCADGKWLILSIVPDQRRWEVFKRAVASPMLDDPLFATVASRTEHALVLTEVLDVVFAAAPRADWVAALERSGIVFGIVAEMEDIPDPQMTESGALVPFADDALLTVSAPFWVEGVEKVAPTHAPEAGADSEAVLREAGFAAGEIEALIAAGVVGARR